MHRRKMKRKESNSNDIVYRYRVIIDTEYGLVLQCVLYSSANKITHWLFSLALARESSFLSLFVAIFHTFFPFGKGKATKTNDQNERRREENEKSNNIGGARRKKRRRNIYAHTSIHTLSHTENF